MPKPKKCPECGDLFTLERMGQKTCRKFECALAYGRKIREAKEAKAKKETARSDKARLKELDRPAHLDKLQRLVNQYVVHVRDSDKACCTCGTTANVKYDAGHFLSRGARPELRFELTNIHKQCSMRCNQHASGNAAEYERFIIEKYGQDHLDWLKGPHPRLKDQLPDAESIDKEIARYRKMLRSAGIKPAV